MTKYYKTDIPTKIINCYYGTRQSGKTYFENNKIKKTKEDKKIEKISLDDYVEFTTSGDIQRLDYMFNKNTNTFVDKINEIIDKVNGGK